MLNKWLCLMVILFAAASPAEESRCRAADERMRNQKRFETKLRTLTWLAYTPSRFSPHSEKAITDEEIEADLRTLIQHGFRPEKTGLCTYGCDPEAGLDRIAVVARRLGFAGHILGVWSIETDGKEFATAKKLAKEGLCDAVCIGNEGLEVRYEWDQLQQAMQQMRAASNLPISTSEQIDDYGFEELCDPKFVDFLYPNIHPVFQGVSSVEEGVDYVEQMISALKKQSSLPLIAHETGFPSRGIDGLHTPENQKKFWQLTLDYARKSNQPIVLFEMFSQPWKLEPFRGVEVGTSWGWFTADREPKPVVDLISKTHPR